MNTQKPELKEREKWDWEIVESIEGDVYIKVGWKHEMFVDNKIYYEYVDGLLVPTDSLGRFNVYNVLYGGREDDVLITENRIYRIGRYLKRYFLAWEIDRNEIDTLYDAIIVLPSFMAEWLTQKLKQYSIKDSRIKFVRGSRYMVVVIDMFYADFDVPWFKWSDLITNIDSYWRKENIR